MKVATARCNPENLKGWFCIDKFAGPGEYTVGKVRYVITSDSVTRDKYKAKHKGGPLEPVKAGPLPSSLFVEIHVTS